jgi:hypothetical protein
MLVGYAIEPLRAEATLPAASTPPVEAVRAAGYRNDVDESNKAMACTPRLGLQRGFVLILSGRCVIAANLIPSLRTDIRCKAPMGARSKPRPMGGDALLWREFLL